MFHKNALTVNCTLVSLCLLIWSWTFFELPQMLNYFKCSGILWLVLYFLIFYILSIILLFVMIAISSVKTGKPPLGSLVIAYKFGYSNTLTFSDVNDVNILFPANDKVQICYERRFRPFGIAHGVIIHNSLEDVSEESKELAIRHGYRIFHLCRVTNALYISCPNIPWLSHLGTWLILCIAFRKIYKYSKRGSLSAYPVVQVCGRSSVLLVVPLSRQDNFFVPEAQCLLQRSSTSLNSSVISSVNESASAYRHSTSGSLSFHSFSTKGSVVGLTNTDDVKTLPVKLANGNTKQG